MLGQEEEDDEVVWAEEEDGVEDEINDDDEEEHDEPLTGEDLLGWNIEVYFGGDDSAPFHSNAELGLACGPPSYSSTPQRAEWRRHHQGSAQRNTAEAAAAYPSRGALGAVVLRHAAAAACAGWPHRTSMGAGAPRCTCIATACAPTPLLSTCPGTRTAA